MVRTLWMFSLCMNDLCFHHDLYVTLGRMLGSFRTSFFMRNDSIWPIRRHLCGWQVLCQSPVITHFVHIPIPNTIKHVTLTGLTSDFDTSSTTRLSCLCQNFKSTRLNLKKKNVFLFGTKRGITGGWHDTCHTIVIEKACKNSIKGELD